MTAPQHAHKPVGVVAIVVAIAAGIAVGRDEPLRPLRWLARDEFREPGVEVAFEIVRALAALLAPKPGDLGEAQPVSIASRYSGGLRGGSR
jgi:hypothetical protein